MNVFCLLTGRGNNTLRDKNILPVLGKPLMAYPALAASSVVDIENCYISSDDEKILEVGSGLGFSPIKRPADLAGPEAKHVDAITHAVSHIESIRSCKIDILVVILANSATVKPEWIANAIKMIEENPKLSAVVPAYLEQDHHPYRAKKLDESGILVPYFDFGDEDVSTNRQELPENYFLCHNFWVLNVRESLDKEDGFKPWVFLGRSVKPLIVENSFDVHTMEDITRTEKWLKNNLDGA